MNDDVLSTDCCSYVTSLGLVTFTPSEINFILGELYEFFVGVQLPDAASTSLPSGGVVRVKLRKS